MEIEENRSKIWKRGNSLATTVPQTIVLIRRIQPTDMLRCFWELDYEKDSHGTYTHNNESNNVTVRFDDKDTGNVFELPSKPFVRRTNSVAVGIPDEVCKIHDVGKGDEVEWDIDAKTGDIVVTFLSAEQTSPENEEVIRGDS